MPNDWVATHLFNGFQLVFPRLEQFLIRSVADVRADITDPDLAIQAKGFIRQEASHARQHTRFLQTLRDHGYTIDGVLTRQDRFVTFMDQHLPTALRLAITAGGEHYTALIGHGALAHRPLDEAHRVVRDLMMWHAAEEVEHKAVAFDILAERYPGYALRVAGLVLSTGVVAGLWMLATASLMRQEVRNRGWAAFQRPKRAPGQRVLPPLSEVVSQAVAYLNPGFHPWDTDDLHLAQDWFANEFSPKCGVGPTSDAGEIVGG